MAAAQRAEQHMLALDQEARRDPRLLSYEADAHVSRVLAGKAADLQRCAAALVTFKAANE